MNRLFKTASVLEMAFLASSLVRYWMSAASGSPLKATWILTMVPNLLKCSLSLVMLFNSWGIFFTSNLVFVYWFFLRKPGLL